MALLRFKLQGPPGAGQGSLYMPHFSKDFALTEEVEFCGKSLDKVSRSFAKVIRNLPPELSLPICVFYLALRALDTVEDDMDLTKFDVALSGVPILISHTGRPVPTDPLQVKILSLRYFWTLLYPNERFEYSVNLAGFKAGAVGEADEAVLLYSFDKVIRVFGEFPQDHKDVVGDITKKMGNGMADYINRDLREGTDDPDDYNLYCHIVAGQVGEGLSRQFALCGRESKQTSQSLMTDSFVGIGSLCSDMGLFLQKTNIIRDYLEDFVDGRAFWPKLIWRKHVAPGGSLGDLGRAFTEIDLKKHKGPFPEPAQRALSCLNEMITDAFELFPRSLAYLRQIHDPFIFGFCTIPQLMALATLQTLYSNPKTFTGVLKIRKGIACRILMDVTDWEGLVSFVTSSVRDLRKTIEKDNYRYPTEQRTLDALDDIERALVIT
jgi:farnesyl-diphosphate farnesyltransferase